jgi:hypothetical protein
MHDEKNAETLLILLNILCIVVVVVVSDQAKVGLLWTTCRNAHVTSHKCHIPFDAVVDVHCQQTCNHHHHHFLFPLPRSPPSRQWQWRTALVEFELRHV